MGGLPEVYIIATLAGNLEPNKRIERRFLLVVGTIKSSSNATSALCRNNQIICRKKSTYMIIYKTISNPHKQYRLPIAGSR